MGKESLVSKKIWESKTIWVNLILAVVAFVPSLSEKINEEMLMQLMVVANLVLRMITKDKVSLS